jgi:hypothetical protein
LAARLRAVLLPLDDERLVLDLRAPDDRLVPDDLRALDVERRLEELEDELVLRLRPLDAAALDFRAPPDELDDLRAPEPLDLRALDPPELRALDPRALALDDLRVVPPDDFFRDDPPPLPELDSAIALPPLKLCAAYPLGARGTICPARR